MHPIVATSNNGLIRPAPALSLRLGSVSGQRMSLGAGLGVARTGMRKTVEIALRCHSPDEKD